jgi:mRNA interferase RelE/StbE
MKKISGKEYKFEIKFKNSILKDIEYFPKETLSRIKTEIETLKNDSLREKLLKGQFKGFRRVRIGDYRIVYCIFEKEKFVLITRIAHRKEIYKVF